MPNPVSKKDNKVISKIIFFCGSNNGINESNPFNSSFTGLYCSVGVAVSTIPVHSLLNSSANLLVFPFAGSAIKIFPFFIP